MRFAPRSTPTSLIPVPKLRSGDVTGIQPPRVCAGRGLFFRGTAFPMPKDLGMLDSCDIARAKPGQRNEGKCVDVGGKPSS